MYPFQDNFRDLIHDFLERLHAVEGLRVDTTATSSIIFGDYNLVMQTLTELMAWSRETHGRCVFVAKFIPGHQPD